MPMNEADTRANLIDPKLEGAGWGRDRVKREHYFVRDRKYTAGRIYLVGDEARRREPRKVDYLLRYSEGFPIAVVEAKGEDEDPGAGILQAKTYAESLGVLFSYSTNGHGIVEFDFVTNTQTLLRMFPSPEELFQRFNNAVSLVSAEAPAAVHAAVARYRIAGQAGIRRNPFLYPYCPPIQCGKEPRYFQEVAVNRAIAAIVRGRKRLLLNMATGTGKTFIAFQLVWKLVKSEWLRRVLFLADRNILRDQAYNTFGPFADGASDPRQIIEEGQINLNRELYFGIYQALWSGEEGNRLYQRLPPAFFDLIIIDECHRSGFGTWNEILRHFPDAIQLGMTATPKRDDNVDTYVYFGDPVYAYSLGQGIEDGFLATYKVHRVRTTVDTQRGLVIEEARAQGAEIYVPPEGPVLRATYHTPQFEREITLPDRTQVMCDHLASLLRTFDPMERTMVFCVDMDHAGLVAQHLQNHFAHLGHPDYAVRIVSEDGREARELFEKFQDSERRTPVVATSADLLTTGVDVPSVRNIVFMKTVSSPVVFKQIVGRGSRVDPATAKLWFRVIDYTGATRLLDDWDRPPGPPPKLPIGPFTAGLSGVVVAVSSDGADGPPIEGALVTVVTGPNTSVQARTRPDGGFRFEGLPAGTLQLSASATGYWRRALQVDTIADREQHVVIALKPERAKLQKIRVQHLEVTIADEATFLVEATGEHLTFEQYIDYTRARVADLVPAHAKLWEVWRDAERRRRFLRDLEGASIHLDLLAELLEKSEADQYDLLANLAFGAPLRNRSERAAAFTNREQRFLKSYGVEAREVILALLEKYRVAGVEEISTPEIFRVPPFNRMGQAPGIMGRFGGPEPLRETMADLQRRLYPPEELT